MNGRIKFQVWSEDKSQWRTVYCLRSLFICNIIRMEEYGFKIRTGGDCR